MLAPAATRGSTRRQVGAKKRTMTCILAALPSIWPASRVAAQEPAHLPAVSVTALPTPRPHTIAGVVRDTLSRPVEGAEVSIISLRRRAVSGSDGSFRLDDIPFGTFDVRARRVGFAPQVREVMVGGDGGTAIFALVPLTQRLPAVVSSAVRGGLSGVIADTSYAGLAGVRVAVLGRNLATMTDSLGAFFIPASAGSYMVTIAKAGFASRLASVTIPVDSGRRMTAFLYPADVERLYFHASNVADLEHRMTWRNRETTTFYTREELITRNWDWVYQAVVMGGGNQFDRQCAAIVNGGPETVEIGSLTVDDIESVEVYSAERAGGSPNVLASGTVGGQRAVPRGAAAFNPMGRLSNTREAVFMNTGVAKLCPTAIYVWMR